MPIVDRRVSPGNWTLSEKGRRDAETLAGRLDLPGDALVLSSDEVKARQTAETFSKAFAVDPRLREVDRPWVEDEYERIARRWLRGEDAARWEPQASVVRRMVEVMGEANTRGSTVCVVSHGLAISALMADLADVDPVEFWSQLQFPDSVTIDLPFSTGDLERGGAE